MADDRELRCFSFEIREDSGSPKIRGYAAVFDKESEDLGGFREIIKKGAFAKTIQESDVRALWNHNPDYVLGRTKNGALRLQEDDHGLAIEIDPPNTTWAKDLAENIRRKDVDQMSFSFRVVKEAWHNLDDSKNRKRELLEVALYDVSPVTFPAYPQTSVSVRSKIDALKSESHPQPEPAPAGHSDTPKAPEPVQADHSIELKRRRLDLAEKINGGQK